MTPSVYPSDPSISPPYWETACEHLSAKDRIMSRLIAQHGGLSLPYRGDAFATLARSIVGQQISTKAADAVWQRFQGLCQQVDPHSLLRLKVDDMRQAGLSARKVEYLVDLALHFTTPGKLHPADWVDWSDENIIRELLAIRGVGRWTAEMFLIFHLRRPNVLPLDDVGLVNGISHAYFSGEPVSRSDMREVAQAWQPYCTVATWYIWRSLTPIPVAH